LAKNGIPGLAEELTALAVALNESTGNKPNGIKGESE